LDGERKALSRLKLFADVPGGIGPLVVAELFQRVIEKAEKNTSMYCHQEKIGSPSSYVKLETFKVTAKLDSLVGWSLGSMKVMNGSEDSLALERNFYFRTYKQAIDFFQSLRILSDELYHHPNFSLRHNCRFGVDVHVSVYTHAINGISDRDFELASKITTMYDSFTDSSMMSQGVNIDAKKFTYMLPDELISRYPKSRGTSRLLARIPTKEDINHPSFRKHFKNIFPFRPEIGTSYEDKKFPDILKLLPNDVHLIFNHSKVFQARLFARRPEIDADNFEVMFLNAESMDTGTTDALKMPANGQEWRCMIRKADLNLNDIFFCSGNLAENDLHFYISKIHSTWNEETKMMGLKQQSNFRNRQTS